MESRLPFKTFSTLPPRMNAQFALSILFSFILGACFAEHAFDQLGWFIKRVIGHIAIDKWTLEGKQGNKKLTDAVDSLKQDSTDGEKEQIDEVVEKAKTIIAGLWDDEAEYNYQPIGCYITGW